MSDPVQEKPKPRTVLLKSGELVDGDGGEYVIVPARLQFRSSDGTARDLPLDDVRQIDPPLAEGEALTKA